MKNDSEQQSGSARLSEVTDLKMERIHNDVGEGNCIWAAHELQEDFTALKLIDADVAVPRDDLRLNVGCHNTKPGALPTEPIAGAEKLTVIDYAEAMQETKWKPYCKAELSSRSNEELQALLRQLRSQIEDVSVELVALLQERQRLREEVPIRNVTIAQLLKVHEQLQLNFTEPLAIQMSVIFPDQNEALDCL